MESQFARSFRDKLESFSPGLASDVGALASLPDDVIDQVLRFLLESACLSQSMEAIRLGREKLQAAPRRLMARIEALSFEVVDCDDDYEFRRLAELAVLLDDSFAGRVLARGAGSPDADVKDAAAELRAKVERRPRLVRVHLPSAVSASRVAPELPTPSEDEPRRPDGREERRPPTRVRELV